MHSFGLQRMAHTWYKDMHAGKTPLHAICICIVWLRTQEAEEMMGSGEMSQKSQCRVGPGNGSHHLHQVPSYMMAEAAGGSCQQWKEAECVLCDSLCSM